MKKSFFFLLFLFSLFSFSQLKYPKGDFIDPIKIPIVLAGNFAELRNNHFHGGLDIKTNQVEGYNIYSIANGYVSRIKISGSGYGNALYIDHPNGYTSVYAHLKEFSPKIKAYIRAIQYEKKLSDIDEYPKKNTLVVEQGEVVAISGNSGGSSGPHLHFEIRNTKTETPINPFLLGYEVADTSKPMVSAMYIYPIDGDVQHNKSKYKIVGTGSLTNPIYASGKIGIGVKANDRHDGQPNVNGIYRIQVQVNKEEIFNYVADWYSFDWSRHINSLTDYEEWISRRGWIYKCFVEGMSPVKMIKKTKENGLITLQAGEKYYVKVMVTDFAGNISENSFVVIGKENTNLEKKDSGEKFYWNKENKFTAEGISISFPKGSFYKDFGFEYKKDGEKHVLHTNLFPVFLKYDLSISPEGFLKEKWDKLVVVRSYKERGSWKKEYLPTTIDGDFVKTKTKYFGTFYLEEEIETPIVTPLNLKNGSKLYKGTVLRFRIKDVKAGIDTYNVYIDEKWVISYFDRKYNSLKVDLDKENISIGEHFLKLEVTDNQHNKTTIERVFYKVS